MEINRSRISRAAPEPGARPQQPSIEARVLATLRDEFAVPNLSGLPDFMVVVEGATDRGYIQRAAELFEAAHGVSPLDVPPTLRRGSERRIAVVVPGENGRPASGGVKRMVDMAAALFGDFFRAEVLLGIVFVFDHDWAGREARDQIKKYGFRPDRHSLTLDPSAHPTLVGRPDVLIEDLIPLPAQEAFFALGGANCSKEYRDGQLRRIRWEHPSKAALRRYICTHSGIRDFGELVLLISRVRAALGFPAIDVRSGGTQEGGA